MWHLPEPQLPGLIDGSRVVSKMGLKFGDFRNVGLVGEFEGVDVVLMMVLVLKIELSMWNYESKKINLMNLYLVNYFIFIHSIMLIVIYISDELNSTMLISWWIKLIT